MGSGASSSAVAAAINAASPEQLRQATAGLSADSRAKLEASLKVRSWTDEELHKAKEELHFAIRQSSVKDVQDALATMPPLESDKATVLGLPDVTSLVGKWLRVLPDLGQEYHDYYEERFVQIEIPGDGIEMTSSTTFTFQSHEPDPDVTSHSETGVFRPDGSIHTSTADMFHRVSALVLAAFQEERNDVFQEHQKSRAEWLAKGSDGRFPATYDYKADERNEPQLIWNLIMDEVARLGPHVQEQIFAQAMRFDGRMRVRLPDNMKKNDKIAIAAMQQRGDALEHASDDMKNNETIVMAAVQQKGDALRFASDGMKNNEAIVLAAVQQFGDALKHASDDMKNNEAIVMAAVQNHGYALMFASDDMKNNEAIVLAAVQQFGDALRHASDDMKNNEDIVLAAVQNHSGEALEYASEAMKQNEVIVKAAAQQREIDGDPCDFF